MSKHQLNGVATLLPCFKAFYASFGLFGESQGKRGVDLISDALPFGCLRYVEPDAISNAIDYARFRSRSHDAVIRVYDNAGNVIETHEQ